ncbi:MAG: radical SAM protein [Flexilinea sp.]
MNPIYQPKGKAGEYAGLAINIYTGCPHGCTYCYVPAILRVSREAFRANVAPRAGIVNAVYRQLEREQISGQLIHLCFTCDPYPSGVDTTVTREIIQAIKSTGNHVQILTKNPIDRDFDLLDAEDWFGVTISSYADMARIAEPGAPAPGRRLDMLRTAKEHGISTWISAEPVLETDIVYRLLIHGWGDYDKIAIGKLNHQPSDIDWKGFARRCVTEAESYGRNYVLKEDLLKELENGNKNSAE